MQTQAVLEGLRQQLADENRKLDAKKNEHDLVEKPDRFNGRLSGKCKIPA